MSGLVPSRRPTRPSAPPSSLPSPDVALAPSRQPTCLRMSCEQKMKPGFKRRSKRERILIASLHRACPVRQRDSPRRYARSNGFPTDVARHSLTIEMLLPSFFLREVFSTDDRDAHWRAVVGRLAGASYEVASCDVVA